MSEDARPLDAHFARVYDELRRVAGAVRRRKDPHQTLSATELVHEAYVRLADRPALAVRSERHVMGLAVQAIRWTLVDLARWRLAEMHGAGAFVTLEAGDGAVVALDPTRFLDLHDALAALAAVDPRQAAVIEYRLFGFTLEEIARALDVSVGTVKHDWAVARAWLNQRLTPG